jgi:hypothetical protein
MACIIITAAKTEGAKKSRPFNVSGTSIDRLLICVAPSTNTRWEITGTNNRDCRGPVRGSSGTFYRSCRSQCRKMLGQQLNS